jgi:hypothetical protein
VYGTNIVTPRFDSLPQGSEGEIPAEVLIRWT